MRVALLIDGTFIPARDGASTRFANLTPHLLSAGVDVQVYHCYRGWSSLDLIAEQEFDTYFFPGNSFYGSQDLIARLMIENGIQIVQANDLETMATMGFDLARQANCLCVLESHYHSSTLARVVGRSPACVRRLEQLEFLVGFAVDAIVVFTPQDRDRWVSLSGADPRKVKVIPFGVNRVTPPALDSPPRMAFLGNGYFEPNERAIRSIVTSILPGVRHEDPAASLRVIGDLPASLRRDLEQPGVEVLGEVSDVRPALRSCALGLAPVTEGTGLRTKILEYLAAGLPVVASTAAVEGLNFPALFSCDGAAETVNRCCALLSGDRAVCDVRCSQQLLERDFAWNNIAALAADTYGVVHGQPTGPRPALATQEWSEPMWLREVLDKGRFSRQHFTGDPGYIYGIAGSGRIQYFLNGAA